LRRGGVDEDDNDNDNDNDGEEEEKNMGEETLVNFGTITKVDVGGGRHTPKK